MMTEKCITFLAMTGLARSTLAGTLCTLMIIQRVQCDHALMDSAVFTQVLVMYDCLYSQICLVNMYNH